MENTSSVVLQVESQTDQDIATEILNTASTTEATISITIETAEPLSPSSLAELLGDTPSDSDDSVPIDSSTTETESNTEANSAVTSTTESDTGAVGTDDASSAESTPTASTQPTNDTTDITVDAEFTDDDVPSFQQNSGTAALLRAVFNADGEWVTVKDVRSAVPDDADIDKSQISKRLWGFANDDLLEKRAGETFNEYCLTPIAKVALNEYEVEHGDDSYRHVGVDLR